ncbi:transposase [Deinococcus sp. SM5_A1]|uniref:transposase n=1 Tax=Deinococcus sp. SM5_A1 TaxID=3379094 RepID=UPI00385C2101
MSIPKQQYTAEFKQETVRLIQSTGKSCAQIARDLGVPTHYVVRWKKQQEGQGVKGRPVNTGRGLAGRSEQEDRLWQVVGAQEAGSPGKAVGLKFRPTAVPRPATS